jgi:hypothetical protein
VLVTVTVSFIAVRFDCHRPDELFTPVNGAAAPLVEENEVYVARPLLVAQTSQFVEEVKFENSLSENTFNSPALSEKFPVNPLVMFGAGCAGALEMIAFTTRM